jgi:signal transduction histidine kinase
MSQPAILIVEDEAIVAEDLSGKIQHLGYEVAGTLATGEEAVAFVRERQPALVLMDVRLAGEIDGIAAALEIRRICDLPVVFLTAHSDEGTVKRAQQAEAFGYILKPFDLRDLRIQIEMAIYKHAAERRLRASEAEISALNRELENRVLERTNELQETVTALETEIQNRQRLERGILEISEREQCRLGQDLHDGLGQELSGIAMLGDALTKQLLTQGNPLVEDADKLATYVRRALDSTRRLAKGLYPIELERHGLRLALQNLADQTSRLTRISCELRHHGAEPKLEKSTEIHIYRIIQECIGNAVKHATPKLIIIESRAGDDMHFFSVTDDGIGFAVPAGSSGMGLHLMHYRARLIRADLTIEQPETGGCRITCRLRGGDPKGGRP